MAKESETKFEQKLKNKVKIGNTKSIHSTKPENDQLPNYFNKKNNAIYDGAIYKLVQRSLVKVLFSILVAFLLLTQLIPIYSQTSRLLKAVNTETSNNTTSKTMLYLFAIFCSFHIYDKFTHTLECFMCRTHFRKKNLSQTKTKLVRILYNKENNDADIASESVYIPYCFGDEQCGNFFIMTFENIVYNMKRCMLLNIRAAF